MISEKGEAMKPLLFRSESDQNSHLLFHEDNQILAGAPEKLRISDAKDVLLVGITLKGVRA